MRAPRRKPGGRPRRPSSPPGNEWLSSAARDAGACAPALDADRGGAFTLAPEIPFEVDRRYVPDTNVLETTFTTAEGVARVTDGMTLPRGVLPPFRELVRRVDGVSGRVPIRWRVVPRFGYAAWTTRVESRNGVPVASAGSDALLVRAWDAGEVCCEAGSIGGRFEAREGKRATIAAAPTTSLPERLGGERNWDYRFCWIRDSAFTVRNSTRACSSWRSCGIARRATCGWAGRSRRCVVTSRTGRSVAHQVSPAPVRRMIFTRAARSSSVVA